MNCRGPRRQRRKLACAQALALVCALCAVGVAPGIAIGTGGKTFTTPPVTVPTGLLPTGSAPIPAVSKTPPARRTRAVPRPAGGVTSSGGEPAPPGLRFVRPSPPALVVPRPTRPAVPALAGTPPGSTRAGSSSHLNLTLLVWVSFFAAAVIAGTAGLIHRVRTRPTGTTIFDRPTSGIDEWLAGAELAATTTPPPVKAESGETAPDGHPDTEGDAPAVPRPTELE